MTRNLHLTAAIHVILSVALVLVLGGLLVPVGRKGRQRQRGWRRGW